MLKNTISWNISFSEKQLIFLLVMNKEMQVSNSKLDVDLNWINPVDIKIPLLTNPFLSELVLVQMLISVTWNIHNA